jgi:hypothetical protein
VNNVAKSKKIKEKTKNTCIEKYNVTSPMLSDVIKQKCINNRLKNHYKNIICNSEKFKNLTPLFSKDEYTGNVSYSTKYPFLCKICNNKFEDELLSGNVPRCSFCYPPQSQKLQTELYDFIKFLLPTDDIQKNIRTIIPPLELDIYIPSKKLAIEFNGLYWHSERAGKKYKTYHLNKTNKCKENGIHLIHIFEDEWLDKQDIIKNKLKHILHIDNKKTIYARNCIVNEIKAKKCNEFLNKNHIQGEDNAAIRYGLFYKKELVAVMTFGNLRLALGNVSRKNEYEMYRFCTSTVVVGAGGKLFNSFIKKYNPIKIISYADYRWSQETAFYSKIGFKLIGNTLPNYWYIDKNYMHRIYRYNFVKHTLSNKLKTFDKKLTEWQNMQLNGYDRIWDCGHLKYEWSV